MSFSFGTIRRCYDQGFDSIVRLVIQLEDHIEDLSAMQVAAPPRLIVAQAVEIKQLKQTVANKDAELFCKLHRENGNAARPLSENGIARANGATAGVCAPNR